ncbi:MAG TPA: ethanolamine ammonia lyase-activating protein [Chloroflexota bacterium]|nr:ethanolamine ammonia lyase-activating protein [Chloroflexota bacterium]
MAEETNGRVGRRGPSPYQLWQKEEGIPVNTGSYVTDLYTLDLAPWPRTGQKGAFVNLADQEEDDGYVLEIAPGGQTEVQHHLYEETIFVLDGRGATTLWQKGKPKQTIEWQRGSMFSPPLNCYYQHFNLDGQKPARFYAVTNAPMVINMYRNTDFVFNDDYVFTDRYNTEENYFTDPGTHVGIRMWRTNYVPDLRNFKLDDYHERGAGGVNMRFRLASNQMECHVSQFPPGTYKKAHKHGVGAHVLILSGIGYSLLWFKGEKPRKIDWKDGSVLSPKAMEYHQHFNTGPTPAAYLALRLGSLDRSGNEGRDGLPISTISEREGGWQIDYEDEDPEVYALFERECAKNGATVVLPRPQYATA